MTIDELTMKHFTTIKNNIKYSLVSQQSKDFYHLGFDITTESIYRDEFVQYCKAYTSFDLLVKQNINWIPYLHIDVIEGYSLSFGWSIFHFMTYTRG